MDKIDGGLFVEMPLEVVRRRKAERDALEKENQRLRGLLREVVHLHDWGATNIDWRNMVTKIEEELSDD